MKNCLAACLFLQLMVASAVAQEWGSIKGRLVFDGDPAITCQDQCEQGRRVLQ